MIRKVVLGLAVGLATLGVSIADPTPAKAGATIQFGFGFGQPVYGGGYYPHYAPPPRRHYRPYYQRAPECWIERRRVVKYNRYGEPYYAHQRVRVCH